MCGTFGSPRDVRFVLSKSHRGGRVSRESSSLGWPLSFFRSCRAPLVSTWFPEHPADKVSGTGVIPQAVYDHPLHFMPSTYDPNRAVALIPAPTVCKRPAVSPSALQKIGPTLR